MMENPLVSIITPCYNDGKYLEEYFGCIKNNSYENIELIIVNDGSSDLHTLSILEKLSKEKFVNVINTTNRGVCKARNLGVKASFGKYILPLDADDLISEDYISKAVDVLEQNNDITLVTTNYKMFGKRNEKIIVESYSLSKLLGHNFLINSSLYRRLDFDLVNGYDENMSLGLEDWDFFIKILEKGGSVHVLDNINFFYRIKSKVNSRNRKIDEKKHEKLRFQIWQNHKKAYSENFVNPKDNFEYIKIVNSKEYRLGLFFISPLRKLFNR